MITQLTNEIPHLMSAIFNQLLPGTGSKRNSRAIANDARQFVRDAKKDGAHAEIAKYVMENSTRQEAFVEVAVWHYRRSADMYRSAAGALNDALELKLNEKNRIYIKSKLKEFNSREQTMVQLADNVKSNSK